MRSGFCFLALVALAGCGRAEDAPHLSIAAAHLERRSDTVLLVADCSWTPSAEMLEGLDHGIALTLDVRVSAQSAHLSWARPQTQSTHRLELRYFPLARQYQWRDPEGGSVRSYALRSAALSALERMEVPLGADFPIDAAQFALRVELDTAALPGALRLPALVRTEWRQSAAEFVWPGRAG